MPNEKRSQETSAGPTLSSTLVARLREAIMRGDFIPGTKLHLDKMRATFGVSLSPLREALCRLESEGLVQIEDQRGYFVAPVSPDNLAEVIRLRVELEGMALREATAHGDTAWEGRILAALHQLNTCKRETADEKPVWEACHRDFHAELISACRMPMLRQFCAMLHDQSDRYRRIFLAAHAPDRDTAAEHAAIAEAMIGRRTEDAVALMRDHIERTGRNIQAALCHA
ncbi:MAG TPA: GntR family transcriptional regulator [Stellaceae bacterium]|jgi:DNA-binding GntR family transcriptional regulator|nr:GntR family transcriptional regulator [Stellaceae bacterium]